MSERGGPSSSEKSEKMEENDSKSSPRAIASGSRDIFNEPIQFNLRGSTITGASPPKFVSLEEIMNAAHGMQNMALAHEIAVDQEFKLKPFEPPDNSYEKLMKETMHKAYFDILREELNSDPPVYKLGLSLMEDVKKGLHSILLPHQTSLKEIIDEAFDAEFIEQKVRNKCLDFRQYANFVIDFMLKVAAPARDDMIKDIYKLTDTVDIFKAILETLEVLKYDLANTLIHMIRPHVQKESVEYERKKFDEMLKLTEDGLRHTKEWLKKHIDKSSLNVPVTDPNIIKNVTAQTLSKAYLDMLEWDSTKEYPETLNLDAGRFTELGHRVYRLVGAAALLLVALSASPVIADAHKLTLKQRITIIMGNTSDDSELEAVLPSVAEEVVLMTDNIKQELGHQLLSADDKLLIKNQITSLKDPNHRIRQIVRQRIYEFLQTILVCSGGSAQVPGGLSSFSNELTAVAGVLLRYVMHNKAVFITHYTDIVTEELSRA